MGRKKYRDEEKPKRYYDFTMLVLILLLTVFGLVMVASASSYTAIKYDLGATYFFKRQALFAAIGIGIMIAVSRFDYGLLIKKPKFLLKRTPVFWLYVACVSLQLAVLVMGVSTNGSTRWLDLPIVGQFQPSELSKICIILMIAALICKAPRRLDSFLGFVVIMAPAVALTGLVVGENLSTALIMMGIAFVVCFVASKKWVYFFVSAIGIGVLGVVGIFTVGYRADRIEQWLDVENKGYQILQGLYAICSGGWFGKGLGNSVQKLGYIPEVQTDMIFSVVCEELGIFGVIVLFSVYVFLLFRIYRVIVNARDLFGALICTGVFAHLALQIILNVAVVTNTLPSTGVVLPFISYGGTAFMVLLFEMGIVLSVSNRIEYDG